jgi:hypothetical protein
VARPLGQQQPAGAAERVAVAPRVARQQPAGKPMVVVAQPVVRRQPGVAQPVAEQPGAMFFAPFVMLLISPVSWESS